MANSRDPPCPPPMVLVDRYVRFENELGAVVKESGQPSLDELLESIHDTLPDSEERDAAIDAEITRYMEEVYEPAFAVLRERKASRPSAVRKLPTYGSAAYYYDCELLDGIEPSLSPLAGAPSVTSLTVRTSWPPDHAVRRYPHPAYIAGSDDAYLVLYFCSYRCRPGFYLVYDTLGNSITIVPPASVSGSRCPGFGKDVAVLGIHKKPQPHGSPCLFYVLAEILFRVERRHGYLRPSNKGALFMWWSPGSGPLATAGRQWIQRDVVLPIPTDDDDEGFHADMAIPVSGRCICWVDLLKGILVWDDIDRLAAGDSDTTLDAPVFYFIPLPDGCAIQPDWRKERRQPDEYRSMCSISSELLRFVAMETCSSEGRPMDKVLFRAWHLFLPRDDTGTWRWEMVLESRVDLWNDPVYKNDLKLQPLMPRFPVISTVDPDIIYLLLTDFGLERGWTVATGCYVFGLDIRRGNITSAIRLPCDKHGMVRPLKIFASRFSSFLTEEMILWRRSLDLTDGSIMGNEIVAHEGESRGKFASGL